MQIKNVTLGADPELFLVNEKKNNSVVSSIGIIPGEKGKPYHSEDMPEGFGLEIDNILAEFNIPPAESEEAFITNIEYMKDYINKFVKEKDPNLGIQCIASRNVSPDQLQSKEAKLFGCDPDFNAYTESENPKPKGDRTNLRSAGFHVHVGYENNNIDTSLELVKYMDLFLGLPSVVLDPDKKRRKLYGKAGSFRLQPWGVEYRVLSSAMMKDSDTIKFVYRGTMRAITAYNTGMNRPNEAEVIDIINRSLVDKATEYINAYGLLDYPYYVKGKKVVTGRKAININPNMRGADLDVAPVVNGVAGDDNRIVEDVHQEEPAANNVDPLDFLMNNVF